MDLLRLLVVLVLVCSCGAVQTVPVETVRVEKEYVDRVRVDSVRVTDSVVIRETGDTVSVTKWRTEYRDRLVRDTVQVVKVDTVTVTIEVEVERVERVTPRWAWWLIGLLAVAAWPTWKRLIPWVKKISSLF